MKINNINEYIGMRLKLKRSSLGITQSELGDTIGVTFQQIQKYEKGTNKIGASRLYDLSKILNIPITYFFDGFDYNSDCSNRNIKDSNNKVNYDIEEMNDLDKELMTLYKFFSRIKNKKIRNGVIELAKSLSQK